MSLAIIFLVISVYGGRAKIRLDGRSEGDSPYSGTDVTSAVFLAKQRQHCSCFRKGSCVQVGGGLLTGVSPLFSVLLHRSSFAPMRSGQRHGSQATFQ